MRRVTAHKQIIFSETKFAKLLGKRCCVLTKALKPESTRLDGAFLGQKCDICVHLSVVSSASISSASSRSE